MNDELVVIPLKQLTEIIQASVNSTMESWLNKKIQQEREDKANEEEMLTINEVASKYKICRSTVYNKIRSGDIQCNRIGSRILISKANIEKALKRGNI